MTLPLAWAACFSWVEQNGNQPAGLGKPDGLSGAKIFSCLLSPGTGNSDYDLIQNGAPRSWMNTNIKYQLVRAENQEQSPPGSWKHRSVFDLYRSSPWWPGGSPLLQQMPSVQTEAIKDLILCPFAWRQFYTFEWSRKRLCSLCRGLVEMRDIQTTSLSICLYVSPFCYFVW